MVNGEADQDSIENAEESMSPRQRRLFDWATMIHKMAAKQFGKADELSED